MRQFLLAVSALGLVGCGVGGAFDRPTDEQVRQQFQAITSGKPTVLAKVKECQAGTSNGRAVNVCTICVVYVSVERTGDVLAGGRTALKVSRGDATAEFHKAVSADHPDVTPNSGQPGVWVMAPETIKNAGNGFEKFLGSDFEQRTGFQSRTGLEGFSIFAVGGVPDGVMKRFDEDQKLREDAAATLNGCSAPPTISQPVQSAPAAETAAPVVTEAEPPQDVPGVEATAPSVPYAVDAPTAEQLQAARAAAEAAARVAGQH